MNFYALKVAGSIQQEHTRGKWITKYISFVNVNFLKELKKELATRAISAGHLASLVHHASDLYKFCILRFGIKKCLNSKDGKSIGALPKQILMELESWIL